MPRTALLDFLQVKADVDQIGTNAMIYNPKNTVFWKQGELMLKCSAQAFEPPSRSGYASPAPPIAAPAAPGSAKKKVRMSSRVCWAVMCLADSRWPPHCHQPLS